MATGRVAGGRRWARDAAIGVFSAFAVFCAALTSDAQGAEGTWSPTGPMGTARSGLTATLLGGPPCKASPRPDYCGKVLVAGGTTRTTAGDVALSSAELYDPKTETWKPTGSLKTARSAHSATLLANGKVLVVGGRLGTPYGTSGASVELYDPVTGTWSGCSAGAANASCPAPMNADHLDSTATLLKDGRVLVVGFSFSGPQNPELYNPGTGTWTATGPLNQGRYQHTATLLANGKVLVAGGTCPVGRCPGPEVTETKASSELYDPAANSWRSCGKLVPSADCPADLAQSRADHSATLLPDGKVLVAGGAENSAERNTAEVYDPATGAWTPAPKLLNDARDGHGAVLLPNGKVLAAGGRGPDFQHGLASAELYDAAALDPQWTSAGSMSSIRSSSFVQPHSVWAVLLSSDANAFEADPAVCGTNCGKVLVVGGELESGQRLASAELYTPLPPPTPPPPPSGGTGSSQAGSGPTLNGTVASNTGTPDTSPPVVSGFGMTNNPFVVGAGPTPTFANAARTRRRSAGKHKKGTTFRYRLSEEATVNIVIFQRRPGRRKAGRCVAPTRTLRKARKCRRIVVRGTLTRASRGGANRVAFSGRIGSKRLPPGAYSATLIATDAARNTSRPKTISFVIVKR